MKDKEPLTEEEFLKMAEEQEVKFAPLGMRKLIKWLIREAKEHSGQRNWMLAHPEVYRTIAKERLGIK